MTVPRLSVLHVINQLAEHGGAEVSLLELLPELESRGIRNVVLPLRDYDRGAAARRLASVGITVLDPVDRSLLGTVPYIRRRLVEIRPHLVHTTLFDADVHGRLAAVASGVPVVTSVVNTQYEDEARPPGVPAWKLAGVRRVDSLLARHCNVLLHAITEATAASARRRLGVPPERIVVVPRGRSRAALGTPGREGRAALLRELGIPEDAEVVLNVGRQEHQKGQLHLVRAFASARSRRPKLHLVIAGREGAASIGLREEIRRLRAEDGVHLLGARRDVPDLLRACDVFAFTSLWEGLGGSVLEAMALEAPVVAFGIPPVAEVLKGTGVLVPPGDAEALGAALVAALSDRPAALDRATRARRRFDAEYELGRVADAMVDLYTTAWSRSATGANVPLIARLTVTVAGRT